MVLEYPNFSPVIINLWGLKIHWYGLMYVLAFFSFITLGRYKIKKNKSKNLVFTKKSLDDFLFYGFIGVIFGGRIGYCLFYNFTFYISNPIKIFFVWEGGMSFHGGLLGVLVAVFIYARKSNIKFFSYNRFHSPINSHRTWVRKSWKFYQWRTLGKTNQRRLGNDFLSRR